MRTELGRAVIDAMVRDSVIETRPGDDVAGFWELKQTRPAPRVRHPPLNAAGRGHKFNSTTARSDAESC